MFDLACESQANAAQEGAGGVGTECPLPVPATLASWWAPWRGGSYIFSLSKGNVSAQCDSSETRQEPMLREHRVSAITIHNTMITTRARCFNKLRYECF